ncbi:conserved hypothetical protein [Candidatus Defluviicoccus seviourii]|uniref:Uncharacterized protein n=2 Tax=root TaxID=1 RepID=A0A564W950_9PROT|nr:conserved hypothetical protein [uncultured Defluviicoccus sp.]VUX44960.1 conserved hypothetical protein [Candidatus Defluviicoccus seviourii]HRW61749.1 hypothetical protein [Defluviicoccus sp.]
MTIALVDGFFTEAGSSDQVSLKDRFNLSLHGNFTANVVLQRSFDRGVTWHAVETLTAPIQTTGDEPEAYVNYRLSCTSYTAGPVFYRLSQ